MKKVLALQHFAQHQRFLHTIGEKKIKFKNLDGATLNSILPITVHFLEIAQPYHLDYVSPSHTTA
jgi:hypothetical protein